MADHYFCIKECNTYNKRFRAGDQFPTNWIESGYLPNHHFKQFRDNKECMNYIKAESSTRPIQCAGDDPRSTNELKAALGKFMNVSEKWTRKEIWNKLNERETADARTMPPAETKQKAK